VGPARAGTRWSSAGRPSDRPPRPGLVCRAPAPDDPQDGDQHRVQCTDSDQHSRDATRTAAGCGTGRTAHGGPARRDAVPDTPGSRRSLHRRRCRAVDGAVSVPVAPCWTNGGRFVRRPRRPAGPAPLPRRPKHDADQR
jgi:hypothetical protein